MVLYIEYVHPIEYAYVTNANHANVTYVILCH